MFLIFVRKRRHHENFERLPGRKWGRVEVHRTRWPQVFREDLVRLGLTLRLKHVKARKKIQFWIFFFVFPESSVRDGLRAWTWVPIISGLTLNEKPIRTNLDLRIYIIYIERSMDYRDRIDFFFFGSRYHVEPDPGTWDIVANPMIVRYRHIYLTRLPLDDAHLSRSVYYAVGWAKALVLPIRRTTEEKKETPRRLIAGLLGPLRSFVGWQIDWSIDWWLNCWISVEEWLTLGRRLTDDLLINRLVHDWTVDLGRWNWLVDAWSMRRLTDDWLIDRLVDDWTVDLGRWNWSTPGRCDDSLVTNRWLLDDWLMDDRWTIDERLPSPVYGGTCVCVCFFFVPCSCQLRPSVRAQGPPYGDHCRLDSVRRGSFKVR